MPQFGGFISDNLEIKFLILYITARLVEPAPFEVLQDLAMCDEGVDYFDFSQCLADLVRTGHLTCENDRYAITAKGQENGRICESSIPYSVRMKAEKNIVAYNQKLRRSALIQTGTTVRRSGSFTVTLSLSDELENVMRLELLVTKESMAKELEKRFEKDVERIYSRIIEVLYEEET